MYVCMYNDSIPCHGKTLNPRNLLYHIKIFGIPPLRTFSFLIEQAMLPSYQGNLKLALRAVLHAVIPHSACALEIVRKAGFTLAKYGTPRAADGGYEEDALLVEALHFQLAIDAGDLREGLDVKAKHSTPKHTIDEFIRHASYKRLKVVRAQHVH